MHRLRLLTLLLLYPVLAFGADKPFDPARDPAKDLKAAEQQAQAERKNILLDVGGNWCGWCLVLDRFVHNQPELSAKIDHFVVLHVNYSRENENAGFLSAYPKPNGFPYFYVLSPQGKLLTAQSTDAFETDHKLANGYNADRLSEFFDRWTLSTAHTH